MLILAPVKMKSNYKQIDEENMKTKKTVCAAMAVVGVCMFFLYGNGKQRKITNELAFENVEALADEESGFVQCWGNGSVVCPLTGTKVEYIKGRSLLY